MKRTLKTKIKDALYAFKHGRIHFKDQNMKIYCLHSESEMEDLPSKFGAVYHLEESRCNELSRSVQAIIAKHTYVSYAVSEASELCKNPNELYYVTQAIDKSTRINNNPLSALAQLLKF